jgi:hypothetical protein
MASNFFLASLASRTKNIMVMNLIYEKFPWAKSNLAINKNLPSNLWIKLFHKAPVELACNLVRSREFTVEELQLALNDKRKTVKIHLFTNGFNSSYLNEAKNILQSDWFTPEYARLWVRSGKVPNSLLKKVILRSSEYFIIEKLTERDLFKESEVVNIIADLPLNSSLELLAKLLEARPELVVKLIPVAHRSLLGALAGNRTTFDQNTWSQIIQAISNDTHSSYNRDALGMLLANPNIDSNNMKTLVDIVKTFPKNIFGTKFLNIKTEQLLRYREANLEAKKHLYIKCDWLEVATAEEMKIVEDAVRILNYSRYPLYNKISFARKYPDQLKTESVGKTAQEELVDLNFIPNKARVYYNEALEIEVSKCLTDKSEWDVMLTLLIDWDQSFRTLLSTAVELAKK